MGLGLEGRAFPLGAADELTGKALQMAAFHVNLVRLFLPRQPAERAPFVQPAAWNRKDWSAPRPLWEFGPGLWLFSPASQPSLMFPLSPEGVGRFLVFAGVGAAAPPGSDLFTSASPPLSSPLLLFFLTQSLDELDDDDAGEKERREEEELVQANTFQNEAMTADPTTGHLLVRTAVTLHFLSCLSRFLLSSTRQDVSAV